MARLTLAVCLSDAGELASATTECVAALSLGHEFGSSEAVGQAHVTLGLIALQWGDLLDAIEHLEKARDHARESSLLQIELRALANLATALDDQGSTDDGIEVLEDVLLRSDAEPELLPRTTLLSNLAGMYVRRADRNLMSGKVQGIASDLQRVHELTEPLLQGDDLNSIRLLRMRTLATVARARAIEGDFAASTRLIRRHVRVVRLLDLPVARALHFEVRARIAQLRGKRAGAALYALAAKEAAAASNKTIEEHCHREAARAYAGNANFERAYFHLDRASALGRLRRDDMAARRSQSLSVHLAVERVHHENEMLALRNELLQHQAETDALTGLLNRRGFEERLVEVGGEGDLVIFDIDHFKSLNDTYGHPFGDQVLSRIGLVLTNSAPKDAVISRLGGEEFVVFSRQNGIEVAEDCRKAIEALAWEGVASELRVTVSAGVATFKGELTSTYQNADAALYLAKSLGRNRVEYATSRQG